MIRSAAVQPAAAPQVPPSASSCPTRRKVVAAVIAAIGAAAAGYQMIQLGERTLDETSDPGKIRGWIIFGDVVATGLGGFIGGVLGAAADWAAQTLAGRCRRPSQENIDHS